MTWYAIFENGATPSNSNPVSTGEVIDTDHLTEQGRTWITLPGDPSGLIWDQPTQAFVTPPPPPTRLAKIDFIQRFTAQEFVALRSSSDVEVQYFMYQVDNAIYVVPSDATVQQALQYCASISLLTAARAQVVGAE